MGGGGGGGDTPSGDFKISSLVTLVRFLSSG